MELSGMKDHILKLKTIKKEITKRRRALGQAELDWDKAAAACDYSGDDGDGGLTCGCPNVDSNDPFCYSDNCPLLGD